MKQERSNARRWAILSILLFCASCSAATVPEGGIEPFQPRNLIRTPNPAFPYWQDIAFCADVPEELKDAALPMFATAMNLVIRTPPPEDNLFYWSGPREALGSKTFAIRLCTSRSPEYTKMTTVVGLLMGRLSTGTRAATFYLDRERSNQREIVVFLLLDRILETRRGNPREDRFAAMTFALAAELYGSVARFTLLQGDALQYEDTPENRARMVDVEKDVARAGIACLERLLCPNGSLTGQPSPTRQRLRQELQGLLDRQRPHLDRWLRDLEKRSRDESS